MIKESLSNIFLHNDAHTFETFYGLSDILSQSNFRRFLQMHKNGSSNTQVDNHHENNDSHIFAFHIRMPAIPVPPIFFKRATSVVRQGLLSLSKETRSPSYSNVPHITCLSNPSQKDISIRS